MLGALKLLGKRQGQNVYRQIIDNVVNIGVPKNSGIERLAIFKYVDKNGKVTKGVSRWVFDQSSVRKSAVRYMEKNGYSKSEIKDVGHSSSGWHINDIQNGKDTRYLISNNSFRKAIKEGTYNEECFVFRRGKNVDCEAISKSSGQFSHLSVLHELFDVNKPFIGISEYLQNLRKCFN